MYSISVMKVTESIDGCFLSNIPSYFTYVWYVIICCKFVVHSSFTMALAAYHLGHIREFEELCFSLCEWKTDPN